MPPIDSTPGDGQVLHQRKEPQFPEPRPGQESDAPARGQPHAGEDREERPSLPEHPLATAADIEDEDADPVIDDGPGIADGDEPAQARG